MTRLERINAMRRKGLTDAEIGMRLRVTRQRVGAIAGARNDPPAPPPYEPPDIDMAEFSAALRRWRTGLGITQNAAAEMLHVRLTTYCRWEQGRPCTLPAMVLNLISKLK